MSKKHSSEEEHQEDYSVPETPPAIEALAAPPYMDEAFLDQVRAAGFPGSHYGDEAFLAACWNLANPVKKS
jgi:hypothetical protein